jgi:hypothetical protein
MKPKYLLPLILLLSILGGCISVRDISGDPQYPTGYKKGAVYVLKKPTHGEVITWEWALIGQPKRINAVRLVSETDYEWLHKRSQFEWDEIPSGTRILITDIVREWTFELGTRFHFGAKFISGPYENRMANIEFICKGQLVNQESLLIRDPEYLEEVPNQPPLPTPVSGTPAAGAPVAPPPGAAGR